MSQKKSCLVKPKTKQNKTTITPTTQKNKNKNKNGNVPMPKKKKKQNKNTASRNINKVIEYEHFFPLSNLIFSLQFSFFSPFQGENFLVGPRRKLMGPTIYFPSFPPTKHTQKSFSPHFLSKIFHLPYFTSNETYLMCICV